MSLQQWLLKPGTEWNGMERNRLFYPILFQILRPEAIQYHSLNPKNFDFGIPNPKSRVFVNNRKLRSVPSRSVPFRSVPFRSGF